MNFKKSIQDFPKQFTFVPEIQNSVDLSSFKSFIIAGMGGSTLAADLLKIWKPEINITVHRDYGLPPLGKDALESSLFIASSYSGNTEETLNAYESALKKGLAVAVISTGGKLINRAKEEKVPYILMPDTGIQPRSASGFITLATLSIMGEEAALKELQGLASTLEMSAREDEGKQLAKKLEGYFPIIYSSAQNAPVAYNWKARFNETGKIAAFTNVFPEVNHNEIMGFDFAVTPSSLNQPFAVLMLSDETDHPRVKLRMKITAELLEGRGISVITSALKGDTVWQKIFSSLIIADFASYYTALGYGFDFENEKTVEEFKEKIGKEKN